MDAWQEWLTLFITGAITILVAYLNHSMNRRDVQAKELEDRLKDIEAELIKITTRMQDTNIKELSNAIIILQSQVAQLPKRNVDRRSNEA